MYDAVDSGYSLEAEVPTSYGQGGGSNVPLGEFLGRPVKIADFQWNRTTGTTAFALAQWGFGPYNDNIVFDPWYRWMKDSRVADKLKHFAYLRGNLRVRFMINSTPFQYGKMRIVYVPGLGKMDFSSNFPLQGTGGFDGYTPGTVNNHLNQQAAIVLYESIVVGSDNAEERVRQYFSTYPGVELHAGTSSTVEMSLPFLWHHDFISLRAYGSQDISLGSFIAIPVNDLRQANEVTDLSTVKCQIAVFAHMENIELHTPTEYTPASEYDKSVISAPASAVAKAAGHLTRVPVIGKFARATQIGATAVADVARIFGFSAPTQVENGERRIVSNFGQMASTSGADTAFPLTFDPKAEVTIDPRVVGAPPADEMAISSIVSREQWITYCEWAGESGQLGPNPLLFAASVGPHFQRSGPTGFPWRNAASAGADFTVYASADSPAGHLAQMFRYWRGSVVFRVEVVCSKYHSGRLLLQFDPTPSHDQQDPFASGVDELTIGSQDVNARYSAVLDLSTTNVMEFTCNYTSDKPYLVTQTQRHTDTMAPINRQPGALTQMDDLLNSYQVDRHMGIFSITVLTELTAPNPTTLPYANGTAPVMINIYAKMGDDFEFAAADNHYTNFSFSPASEVVSTTGKEHNDPNSDSVCFGESVVSLRSIVKRYIFKQLFATPNAAVTHSFIRYPLKTMQPRYLTTDKATAGKSGNRTQTLIGYLSPAFFVERGSKRYKFADIGKQDDLSAWPNVFFPCRAYGNNAQLMYTATSSGAYAQLAFDFQDLASGTQAFARIQGVADVALPYQSNARCKFGTQCILPAGTDRLDVRPAVSSGEEVLRVGFNGVPGSYTASYEAAGEDFSLIYYLAPPVAFSRASFV